MRVYSTTCALVSIPSGNPIALLGPAFVAAIAYVDPGNVAANITAGARYGYLLLWVLVASNASALQILFGLPLVVGGAIVGIVSMALLEV